MEISDEMVEAACDAYMEYERYGLEESMRAALEAALGAQPKPTVEGLEAILRGEEEAIAFVMPDGSVAQDQVAACIEDLAGALKNFAMIEMPSQEPDHWPIFGKKAGMGWPIVGDFRVARATLEKWGLK